MIDALSLVTAAFSSWRTDELIEHNKPTLQVLPSSQAEPVAKKQRDAKRTRNELPRRHPVGAILRCYVAVPLSKFIDPPGHPLQLQYRGTPAPSQINWRTAKRGRASGMPAPLS